MISKICNYTKTGLMIAGLIILGTLFPVIVSAAPDTKKSPIEIVADDLVVDQIAGTAVFTGNVKAVQEGYTLLSKQMIVHYVSKIAGNSDHNGISKIEAFGDVELFSVAETAKGDEGLYDLKTNTVQLIGEVELSKDNNVVHGSKLVYNLDTGKSKLSGGVQGSGDGTKNRVKGVFTPE